MDPTMTLPSETGEIQPEEPIKNSQSLTPLIVFLFIATVILGGLFTWLFLGGKKAATPSTYVATGLTPAIKPTSAISGTVYFQGYAPAGSYIAIAVKEVGQSGYSDVVSGISPDKDGTTEWTWKDAKSGTNYEVKATLKVQGKVIDQSVVQDVSAPAVQVSLPLVSNLQPPTPVIASVSGQINLDGFAPAGSTLQVLAKTVSAVSFQAVVSSISAVDNAPWTWNSAQVGTTYHVKAQLVDANGNVISTGDTQAITAPAGGELLNVYSTVKPAATTVTGGITGTITVNGNIPGGAYLTLATRPSGTTTFTQVISHMSATNSVPFALGAVGGTSYDVQAYLWSNGKPYAASNIITVTAPSSFDVLTINAQQPTQAPSSSTLNVNCGNTQGGLVQATINFNTSSNLPNAVSYNIVVTSATQNQQVVNSTVNPPNPTQSQSITTTYVFQPGATYYAQYAYSTSTGGQMSALSPSIQFACQ